MPVIPTFVSAAPYQDAPPDARVNPAALAAGDNAIADSMERVSSHFAGALAAYQQNQAAATAIQQSAALSMELTDKRLAYQKDPDPTTAAKRFQADVLDWSKQKLAEISDPMVRAHVAGHLSREVGSAYGQVAATSLSNGLRNQAADIAKGIGTQAQLLAAASDPLAQENAASAIRQASAGAVAAGVFDHAAGTVQTSKAFRDAIVIKAVTDPLAAQAMLERYKGDMTADDLASTANHLRHPLIRQLGDNAAGATNGAAGPRGGPIVAGDLPPEAAQLLPALAGGESPAYNIRYTPRGGAAFEGYGQHPNIREPTKDGRTSDAAGRYQFLSSTWNPLAQKLGITDFSPASQDKVAWQLATETYQTNTGRDLAADIRAGGHEQDIAGALNKVWPSLPGGSQQNTSADTWRMRMAGGAGGPSLDARLTDVRQRVDATTPEWARPEVRQHAESQVAHRYNLDQAALADQRAELHREITNLQSGYEQGLTTPDVPEARIRSLLKPADAQAAIETLRNTRAAGELYKGVQWATPAEEQQARQILAVPGSVRARMPRRDGKTIGAPAEPGAAPLLVVGTPDGLLTPGNLDLNARPVVRNADGSISTVRSITIGIDGGRAVVLPTVIGGKVVSNDDAVAHYRRTGEHLGVFNTETAATAYAQGLHEQQAGAYVPAPETPEGLKARLAQLGKYDELLDRKHKALLADPLAYTQSAPEIAARFRKVDPADPASQSAALQASLDLQARLGVPEGQRRVTTSAEGAAIVDKLHRTDPAKADMGLALDAVARGYGEHWPAALGELVTYHKLSGEYQLLAAADTPQQAAGRADLQRALMLTSQTGGWDKLREAAPKDEMRKVEAGLDGTLSEFLKVTGDTNAGKQLYQTMRSGVRTLATYYLYQGTDADTALEKAYQGLFAAKYDAKNGWLAPRGKLTEVQNAALQVQWTLAATDLAAPADRGMPGETEPLRREALWRTVRERGRWIPNSDASGLVLMAPFRNGEVGTVSRADGTPVEIRFDKLPAADKARGMMDPVTGLITFPGDP